MKYTNKLNCKRNNVMILGIISYNTHKMSENKNAFSKILG